MNAEKPVPNPLERLLAPLETFPIEDEPGAEPPVWLRAGDWRVLARPRPCKSAGEEIERFALPGGEITSALLHEGPHRVSVPFNLAEAYVNYVTERWRETERPRALSSRQLGLFYSVKRFIPRSLQLDARRVLIRWQGRPEFPAWPLDESVARLLHFYARCLLLAGGRQELSFRWFWPYAYGAALILTHDVESAEGLRLAVELADLEEERGLRSSFNIVASWYPIDWGIVQELRERGFELGVHGVYHDRSMFSSRESFESQQPAVREAAAKLGAEGFRSPATHRVIDWLAELPVAYDCSVPHSDPFEPQPGGCCSVWPFFLDGIVELPYTLPQDHTLLTLLRHPSIAVWCSQLERIERMHGLAQVFSHPDPGYLGDVGKRALYVEFLDVVRERPGLWKPLPREAARWWRQRDAGDEGPWLLALGTARLDAGVVVLEPGWSNAT